MSGPSDPSQHRTQSGENSDPSRHTFSPPPSGDGFPPGLARRPAFIWTLTVLLTAAGIAVLVVVGQPQSALAWGVWNVLACLLCVPVLPALHQAIRDQTPGEAGLGVVLAVGFIAGVVTLLATGHHLLAWIALSVVTALLMLSVLIIRRNPHAFRRQPPPQA